MIKNRFVLIDAFALIYRAYYALPPTLTKDGHPIQAVYGFTSALLNAIRTLEPEYLAVSIDMPKPTLRHKEYVEYKAHRAPMPEDLRPQIPYVKDILKTMNIPTYGVEGYEGEDILATIVAKMDRDSKIESRKSNLEFVIVTGDLDLLQLIDKDVKVYSMARGINQAVLYDEKKVIERYGLTPAQFVDFKALKGDASDNIPGVKGIGEKGASKLIQEYGSLEGLYTAIENPKSKMSNDKQIQKSNIKNQKHNARIKNIEQNTLKISQNVIRLLLENKETANLSQKLSKIDNTAPLEFNIEDAKIHDYDKNKVMSLFNSLGFKSLLERLPDVHKKSHQDTLL